MISKLLTAGLLACMCAATAGASELPKTFHAMSQLSARALASLPDLRWPLGKALDEKTLAGKSAVQLRIMRNSIFAQCGYAFNTAWLKRYFASRSWASKGKFRQACIKKIDRDNFNIIKRHEAGLSKKHVAASWQNTSLANVEKLGGRDMKRLPDIRAPVGQTPVDRQRLVGKSRSELKLLRNSIYAQYGRAFKTRWLQRYFDSRPWYRKRPFNSSALTKIDLANIELIKRQEYAIRKPNESTILKIGYCEYGADASAFEIFRLVFKMNNVLLHVREAPEQYGGGRKRTVKGRWKVLEGGRVRYRSPMTGNRWKIAVPHPEHHNCF